MVQTLQRRDKLLSTILTNRKRALSRICVYYNDFMSLTHQCPQRATSLFLMEEMRPVNLKGGAEKSRGIK